MFDPATVISARYYDRVDPSVHDGHTYKNIENIFVIHRYVNAVAERLFKILTWVRERCRARK